MDEQIIHIACALDDNFVKPTGVMLCSLFENNKANKLHIHLFSSNLTNDNLVLLQEIVFKYHAHFNYYTIDNPVLENFETNNRISIASYYRIFIPFILKNKVEKVLYLDADMIIRNDISSLWKISLDDYVIAAVTDIAAVDMNENSRLKIPEEYKYFNSGLLIIHIEKWNTLGITRKVIKFLNENMSVCRFHDQDGLNAILYDKCKRLSPLWNQQIGIYYCSSKLINTVYQKEEISDAKTNPVIIHFNGREKPWHYVSSHPFNKEFNKYLKISGLKMNRDKLTFKKLIKKEIYRFFGWARWNYYNHKKYKNLLYAVKN